MGAASNPTFSFFFAILTSVLHFTALQNTENLFSCKRSFGSIVIPRIQTAFTISNLRPNNLTLTMEGKSFIYMFPTDGSCTGSSKYLQVCYRTDSYDVVEEFLMIALLDESWVVDEDTITYVGAKPNESNCRRIGNGNIACCEMIDDFTLVITDEHFGFGVAVVNENTRPFRFRGPGTTFLQEHYEWNDIDIEEYDIQDGTAGHLLLLRLRIDLSNAETSEFTSQNNLKDLSNAETTEYFEFTSQNNLKEFSTTGFFLLESPSSQLGALVGGTISILVILILVIVILVAVVLFLSRRKLKRKGNVIVDVARVNGNTQEEAEYEYADIGPEACNQSNTQLGDDGYCYAVSGASSEPCPYEVMQPESSIPKNTNEHDDEIYVAPSFTEENLFTQLENMMTHNLCRDNIKLGETLGSGQFGEVYRGICMHLDSKFQVAVKTLKEGANEEDRVKFLQEAAIMGQFRHHNIVTMYGVVTNSEPILLVLELLINGDLRHHLLQARSKDKRISMDDHTLLSFCRQIASGMAYLSNKAFVHRDLAARNILVSDDEICKIADFGMSRDLMYESYYVSHGGMIPVKWTAPEALHYKKYSTASDVWSYGILMYEIWSLGSKPFENLENSKVMAAIDRGYRLPPPPRCPKRIYSLMMDCWHLDATQRPSFMELSRQLSMPDSKLLQREDYNKPLNPQVNKLEASLQLLNEL